MVDGAAFAESWLGATPSLVDMLQGMAPEDRDKLKGEVARAADALHAAGKPVSCDVVVLVAKKPE